jgi:hypothetical protein
MLVTYLVLAIRMGIREVTDLLKMLRSRLG